MPGGRRLFAKVIIIAFLVAIVWFLVSSFYLLLREKGQGTKTVWRLTWRIGLSLILFVLLYVSFLLGWLAPGTPGPVGLQSPEVGQRDG